MMDGAVSLSKRIEAVLFIHGDPMTIARLGDILGDTKTAVRSALVELDEHLNGGALRLVYHGDDVQLVAQEYLKNDIDALVQDEHTRGLSRSAAETLAVVAYRGPVSKKDIDHIRGVNSAFALRGLLIRGLISTHAVSQNRRAIAYAPALDFLKFLGISRVEELPEYAEFKSKIDRYRESETAEYEL